MKKTNQQYKDWQDGWVKVVDLSVGDVIAVPKDEVIDGHFKGTLKSSREGSGEDIMWDEIVSIEKVGKERVYDIEVEGTHNFVGNNIFAHNTYVSGSIGIATTTPGNLLDVNGSAGFDSLYVESTSTVSSLIATSTLEVRSTGGVSSPALWVGDGRVGMGTTSPFALLSIQNDDLGEPLFVVKDTNESNPFIITSSGTVGIGTYKPSSIFQVYDSSSDYVSMYAKITQGSQFAMATLSVDNSDGASGGILTYGSDSAVAGLNSNTAFYSSANNVLIGTDWGSQNGGTHPISFMTGGWDPTTQIRMTIDSNGNVGIGTTTPGVTFDVNGSGYLDSLYVAATSTVSSLIATSTLEVRGAGGVSSPALWVGDGRVGMGTNIPQAPLTVKVATSATHDALRLNFEHRNTTLDIEQRISSYFGDDSDYDAYVTAGGYIGFGKEANWQVNGNRDAYMAFGTALDAATTEKMRITGAGRVGIATTTPRAMLGIANASSTPGIMIQTVGNTGAGAIALAVDANSTCKDDNTGTCSLNDVAELYNTNDSLVAGDIVALDKNNPAYVKRASSADSELIGIVSTSPAIVFEGNEIKYMGGAYEPQDGKAPVTLTGRVPVKVNNEGGEIHIGDKIGISSVDGVGKKITSGYSVGIALQNFSDVSGEIVIFLKLESNVGIYESPSGNVGIGTTTPEYKLTVAGDIAATAFINVSTESSKKDIEYLTGDEELSILDKIKNTQIATYYYNDENPNTQTLNPNETEESITHGKRLGLIAENAPAEVLSIDGKGVDLYKLSTFTFAGLKALELKVEDIASRIASLEASGGQGTGGSSIISTVSYPLTAIYKVAKSTLASITPTMVDWVNAALAETSKLFVDSETETDKTYKTFSLQGSREEIQISGSATLVMLPADPSIPICPADSSADGKSRMLDSVAEPCSDGIGTGVRIKFDESFTSIISETEPIKVILTATTRLNGSLYVHEKTRFGFEVREINAQDEGGMFDWIVIARKKGGEENVIPARSAEASAGQADAGIQTMDSGSTTGMTTEEPKPSLEATAGEPAATPPASTPAETPAPTETSEPAPVVEAAPAAEAEQSSVEEPQPSLKATAGEAATAPAPEPAIIPTP